MKSFPAQVLAVAFVLSLLANGLLYLRYSTSRPLVTVGKEVITKKEYQDQLEHQAGREVLDKMVMTRLIAQAAAREGVTPTDKDVDARLKLIERTHPEVLAPFSGDEAKMAEFRQALTTDLALENLRINRVSLSPEETAAYYAAHKSAFTLPQQVKTTTVVTQNSVDAATATDLLRQNEPPDVLGRQPRLRVVGVNGYNPPLDRALSPVLKKQVSDFVQAARVGDIRTFRQGMTFLTFQVNRSNAQTLPPLAQIKGEVERQARLDRAPKPDEELARLYQEGKPTFNYDPDKYAGYFDSFQNYKLTADGGKKTASVP